MLVLSVALVMSLEDRYDREAVKHAVRGRGAAHSAEGLQIMWLFVGVVLKWCRI